ncbi:MAG: Uma2 family endonuclease [Candidatus Eremiobacterota bacterium]
MLDRLFRVEDLESIEGDYELDEGRLIPVTRAMPRHGKVCMRLGVRLGTHCEATGEGVALGNDTGFLLERNPDTLRGPDIAVVAAERWAQLSEDRWPEGAPDLVVEVASPSDMQRKVGQYLEAGARLVWVLYPHRRSVAAYHSDGVIQLLGEDQELTGEPVLPGFRCRIADLFG